MANISSQPAKQGLVEALEAAVALGEAAKVEELLALVEAFPAARGRRSSMPRRSASARALADDPAGFEAAAERFREIGLPFWLAVTLLEHGELTGDEASLERGTRDLRAARGDARGSNGSTPSRRHEPRYRHDLLELRNRESRGQEVLLRVRIDARERLPVMRRDERAR